MRLRSLTIELLLVALLAAILAGQSEPAVKRVLAVGASAGWQHDTVSDALVAIHEMGRESGLWETSIRTDTQLLTYRTLERNAKNLEYFDAVFFYTSGAPEMNAEQKEALLTFVRDRGKGFLGAHSATDTFYEWPAYGELIGGYFDGHPWNQFEARIVVESPEFPAMRPLPERFSIVDEIYQIRNFSPRKSRLLMSLDTESVDMSLPGVKHRQIPIAWSHSYGKGRVFYCSLGHRQEVWQDPRIRAMWIEAFRWAMDL